MIRLFCRVSCLLKRWMVPCQINSKRPCKMSSPQRTAMLSFIVDSLPAVSSVSLLRIINLPLALMMELYASGTFCAVMRKEFWEVCYIRCGDIHKRFPLNKITLSSGFTNTSLHVVFHTNLHTLPWAGGISFMF